MNIRFLFLTAVAASSILVGAHGNKPPTGATGLQLSSAQYGARLVGMPDKLRKQLILTPSQDKKLKAINAKYDTKMKAAFQGGPGQAHDMNGLRPIFEGRWNALYGVLTSKQKTVLRKWVDTHPSGR